MENTYWHKQTVDKPLFPDLLWSRPENKRQAGKLLIVGGNLHGFAAPAEAYQLAMQAGIGSVKVLLPDALKKVVGPIIENGEYAPSTPSGSFSQKAVDELLALSDWADGVLLAGDFGRNSETAIVIEKFLIKSGALVTLTKDAVDYVTSASPLLKRSDTVLVLSIAQLQRLAKKLQPAHAVRFSMDLLQMVEALHTISRTSGYGFITKHLEHLFVAVNGNVSSIKLSADMPLWRVKSAAQVSVWWLQNPSKTFEALTTGIFESVNNGGRGGDRTLNP